VWSLKVPWKRERGGRETEGEREGGGREGGGRTNKQTNKQTPHNRSSPENASYINANSLWFRQI
jgi:hypothetical protein